MSESIEALSILPGGVYIDGTFGRGGHSSEILRSLDKAGRLIAIDRDKDAVSFAANYFSKESRLKIFHRSFSEMASVAKEEGVYGKVNGILLDLGVSSPQLDEDERGFSFLRDGPLDMRMDNTKGQSAMEWINKASVEDISQVLKEYGEERFARRIARAICLNREEAAITTTLRFADIVAKANPSWEKHKHPATRAFQAVRIFVNRELEELDACLKASLDMLAVNGRLVVISFHSLEDRIVKRFLRRQAKGEDMPRKLPIRASEFMARMKIVTRVIKPSQQEIIQNARARSAILRVGEKLS